jgi:hypothetical protein
MSRFCSFSNSNFKPGNPNPVSAKLVFGRLKEQLGMSSQASSQEKGMQNHHHGAGLSVQRSTSSRCKRCLGLGRFVRNCTSPVHCWYSYNYRHVQRTCFRWRLLLELNGPWRTLPLIPFHTPHCLCSLKMEDRIAGHVARSSSTEVLLRRTRIV